jgi:hypothetical protein
MKITQERLAESYCKPQTEEEWKRFTVSRFTSLGEKSTYVYFYNDPDLDSSSRIKSDTWLPNGITEIPVPHFIDLLHDRIAPWRLEEDGFEHITNRIGGYVLQWDINDVSVLIVRFSNKEDNEPDVEIESESGWTPFPGCKTYSQLLTLIQLIKYPK